ncbi:hypothetical protein NQ318_016003 [Aromia moschata]|uniref:Uncharacterized protein n=1 Tax=Aromia moschata TaxID=1265417 RepID=A0AAV8Y2G0_9CUCU|nr:hypothetical protein NQ318_016003 [Aromia moschata]
MVLTFQITHSNKWYPLPRNERGIIEMLIMIGYGDKARTQLGVCRLFNNKYPNKEQTTQSTVLPTRQVARLLLWGYLQEQKSISIDQTPLKNYRKDRIRNEIRAIQPDTLGKYTNELVTRDKKLFSMRRSIRLPRRRRQVAIGIARRLTEKVYYEVPGSSEDFVRDNILLTDSGVGIQGQEI